MKNIEPHISTSEDIKSLIESVNFMGDTFDSFEKKLQEMVPSTRVKWNLCLTWNIVTYLY